MHRAAATPVSGLRDRSRLRRLACRQVPRHRRRHLLRARLYVRGLSAALRLPGVPRWHEAVSPSGPHLRLPSRNARAHEGLPRAAQPIRALPRQSDLPGRRRLHRVPRTAGGPGGLQRRRRRLQRAHRRLHRPRLHPHGGHGDVHRAAGVLRLGRARVHGAHARGRGVQLRRRQLRRSDRRGLPRRARALFDAPALRGLQPRLREDHRALGDHELRPLERRAHLQGHRLCAGLLPLREQHDVPAAARHALRAMPDRHRLRRPRQPLPHRRRREGLRPRLRADQPVSTRLSARLRVPEQSVRALHRHLQLHGRHARFHARVSDRERERHLLGLLDLRGCGSGRGVEHLRRQHLQPRDLRRPRQQLRSARRRGLPQPGHGPLRGRAALRLLQQRLHQVLLADDSAHHRSVRSDADDAPLHHGRVSHRGRRAHHLRVGERQRSAG